MTHPQTAQVLNLVTQGLTDTAVGQRLHLDRQAVGRIRRAHNLPPAGSQPQTLEEKWASLTRPVPGDHLEWTGPTLTRSHTPILRCRDAVYTATRIAYRIRTGRDPEGTARAECDYPHCVAPDHVDDTATRVRDRTALRAVLGMPPRAEHCIRQHDQAVHGRVLPNGYGYCHACRMQLRADRRTAPRPALSPQ